MRKNDSLFDVAIVGGGVMGAAAALAVARRGQRVVLLEQFHAGHTRGSSHGDGRIIRYSYPQPVYATMAERAFEGWREASEAVGQALVETTGGLDLARLGRGVLEELESSFAHLGVPFERLDAATMRRRFPCLAPADELEGLFQPGGGVVRADRAVAAFGWLARERGATLVSDAKVIAVETDRSGLGTVQLRAADGRSWHAGRVIITAGGWSGGILAQLGLELPLTVTQERLIYLPARPGSPAHGIGALPTIIDYHDEANPFYALPQVDVPGVKVGWHRSGPEIDPDAERFDTPALLSAIVAWAARIMPYLEPVPIKDLTCLYTNTPDFDFVIDHHPQWPEIVVGAGFSGHGFKFAPVIGEMLAALALDLDSPVPRDAFRIDRFE